MSSKNLFISDSSESKRIFRSSFLEFFSKCPWYLPVVYWSPISIVMLYFGIKGSGKSIGQIVLLFVMGFLIWSLLEYLIHRFVFHWEPKKKGGIGDRIHFLIHGVHHDYPNDRLRLVAPPSLTTILAIPVFGIFYLICPDLSTTLITFCGTILGYMLYDSAHYFLHHTKLQWGWIKRLQRFHLAHHFSNDNSKFGVSPLGIIWDYVFGTK